MPVPRAQVIASVSKHQIMSALAELTFDAQDGKFNPKDWDSVDAEILVRASEVIIEGLAAEAKAKQEWESLDQQIGFAPRRRHMAIDTLFHGIPDSTPKQA